MGRQPARASFTGPGILVGIGLLLSLPSAAGMLTDGALEAHLPVLVTESALTSLVENGTLKGGPGTSAANAYVLERLNVSAAAGHGVVVRGVEAHVILRNLHVSDGGASHDGIRVEASGNVTIEHVRLENNRNGLFVNGSSRVALTHSDLVDNRAGIAIEGVHGDPEGARGVTVEDNRVLANDRGVVLTNATSNTFLDNAFTLAAGQTGFNFSDQASWENTIPPSNRVNGGGMRWYVGVSNVSGAAGDGALDPSRVPIGVGNVTNVAEFLVYKSRDVAFANFTLASGVTGLRVEASSNASFTDFHVEGNLEAGVEVRASDNVTFSNLSAVRSPTALRAEDAADLLVDLEVGGKAVFFQGTGAFTLRGDLGDAEGAGGRAGAVDPDSGEPPGAPQAFQASRTEAGHVLLTWEPPASDGGFDVISFALTRRVDDGVEEAVSTLASNATTYTDADVSAGASYAYVLRAVTPLGEGLAAEVALTLEDEAPGGFPLMPAGSTPETILLQWDEPVTGEPIDGYEVYRVSPDTGERELVRSLPFMILDFEVSRSEPGSYVVVAVDRDGASLAESEAFEVAGQGGTSLHGSGDASLTARVLPGVPSVAAVAAVGAVAWLGRRRAP